MSSPNGKQRDRQYATIEQQRMTTTCARNRNPTYQTLNSFKKAEQSNRQDPLAPFRVLLNSVRLTPHEEKLVEMWLTPPQHKKPRNILHDLENKGQGFHKEEFVGNDRDFREFRSAADVGDPEDIELKAPPGILEEIVNLELAWKIWNKLD
ncbi:hypothetical protein NW764_016515 [Fusarium oxysporum]|nr:hypothetical protein NW764_016515 [Fusarium oxysporum]